MDTNPHCEAVCRPRHGAPQGHAGTDIQDARPLEAEAHSRLYTIREMAREFEVSIRALRFYEDRGLLHPRREGSVRRYDARDRLHLKMILRGKQLGFTLSEIQGILARQDEESGMADLETSLSQAQIAAQIVYLECQRGQIEQAIAALREAQRRLLESPRQGAGRSGQSGH